MSHVLKFLGALFLLSAVAAYLPFGPLVSAAVFLFGIWKITE